MSPNHTQISETEIGTEFSIRLVHPEHHGLFALDPPPKEKVPKKRLRLPRLKFKWSRKSKEKRGDFR